MLPIGEQYLRSPCEIKTMTNDLITTGFVRALHDEDIEIANGEDTMPVIHCNTLVKVNIYNNILGFKVLIGRVFLSTKDFMRVAEIQNLADFERRDFFRIKVDIAAKAYVIQNEVPPDGVVQLFDVRVADLSMGGLFVKTKKKLKMGQRLIINLRLAESENAAFCCEVQREKPVSVVTNGYGCSFIDNSGRQFDILCKYIFDIQREQIRIAKEIQESQSAQVNQQAQPSQEAGKDNPS